MSSTSTASHPDRRTLLAFAGVVACGGLNAIAVRQTVLELDPLWGAAVRFLAAGCIFAVLVAARSPKVPSRRTVVGAMAYGLVGFAAAFGLIYPALRDVQAGTASVVIALSPLATYGLAVVQRQERFRLDALIGGSIALIGIAIVFLDQLGVAVPIGSLALVAIGVIFVAHEQGTERALLVHWALAATLILAGLAQAAGQIAGERGLRMFAAMVLAAAAVQLVVYVEQPGAHGAHEAATHAAHQ